MLITLLLFTQVGCDWVEISQQHYVKPLRPTHSYHIAPATKPDIDRYSKPNRIYVNYSVPEYNWNKGLFVPNDINAKFQTTTIKPQRLTFGEDIDEIGDKASYGNKNSENQKEGEVITIKTRPRQTTENVDVIRVQMSSAVKPPQKMKPVGEYQGRPIEVLNLSDLEYATEEDIFSTVEIDDSMFNVDKTQSEVSADSNTINKQDENHFTESYFTDKEIKIAERKKINENRVGLKTSTDVPKPLRQNGNTNITTVIIPNIKNDGESRISIHRIPNIEKVARIKSSNTNISLTTSTDNNELKKRVYENSKDYKKNKEDDNISKSTSTGIGKIIRVQVTTTEKSLSQIEKHYEPIKRPIAVRNPEDLMVEEMLKEHEEHLKSVGPPNRVKNVQQINNKTITPVETKITKTIKVKPRPTATVSFPKLMTKDQISTAVRESGNLHTSQNNKTQVISTDKTPKSTDKLQTEKTFVIGKDSVTKAGISGNQQNDKSYKPIIKKLSRTHERPEFMTSEESNYEYEPDEDFVLTSVSDTKTNKNILKSKMPATEKQKNLNQSIDEEKERLSTPEINTKDINKDKGSFNKETTANNTKTVTMENLVKFLKVVTETISKNTRKTVKGKLRYLEDLKDTLMANIEDRLDSAFPDDGSRRRSRSAESRGHVEFPSSESALMTISFLTFAVFLIKLVLQVIQTFKNKTMMVPTVMATVGRAFGDPKN